MQLLMPSAKPNPAHHMASCVLAVVMGWPLYPEIARRWSWKTAGAMTGVKTTTVAFETRRLPPA